MRSLKKVLAAIGSAVLLAAVPATAQQPSSAPSVPESSRPGIGEGPSILLPVVGLILDHEDELDLSTSQVDGLRRLGLDVIRGAIRRQADLMVAQVDLWTLLDRDPDEAMDVVSAEAKIREMAQIRTELEIAFLRALEAAKSQLTPDQRSKLTALLAGGRTGQADPPGASEPLNEARGGGHAPSGGAGSRPPAGARPGGHPFEGRRHFDHGRPFVGGGPFWWGAPYPYWPYPEYGYAPPPAVLEPPQYIQQESLAYWYYCRSAHAYYPSVPTCPEPWVLVAPTG